MSPGHCLCTLLYVNCCLLPIIMHGLLFALWFMSPESKATHSMVYKNALWFMSHGRSLLDKIALCTLVYVTLLKPMAPMSHGHCTSLDKNALWFMSPRWSPCHQGTVHFALYHTGTVLCCIRVHFMSPRSWPAACSSPTLQLVPPYVTNLGCTAQ